MTRPPILDRLKGVKRAGKGWLAFCPSHPDQNKRSLSVGLGDDLRTLVNCHARGCTAEEITSAVGMTMADLAPPSSNGHRAPAPPGRSIVANYDYTDERGELLYQVVRYEPKDFRCRRPDGAGGWVHNLDGVRVVPYRLHELAEAERVLIVEGEKDADALAGLGLVATCNHGGAGKWREEHTRALVGAAVPEVVVFRDNDRPGAAHQDAVARSCAASGLRVKVLPDLPDLPPLREKHGEDVSDWLAAGHTKDELLVLADQAPVFVCSSDTLN
jgi:putative DNA primase/helicase